LIFSNKTSADIICEKEFRHYLGEGCRFVGNASAAPGCEHRRVDQAYLRETIDDFAQNFYVCGPPGFLEAVTAALKGLGADPQALVFER